MGASDVRACVSSRAVPGSSSTTPPIMKPSLELACRRVSPGLWAAVRVVDAEIVLDGRLAGLTGGAEVARGVVWRLDELL